MKEKALKMKEIIKVEGDIVTGERASMEDERQHERLHGKRQHILSIS
jgi:hypothetical protein